MRGIPGQFSICAWICYSSAIPEGFQPLAGRLSEATPPDHERERSSAPRRACQIQSKRSSTHCRECRFKRCRERPLWRSTHVPASVRSAPHIHSDNTRSYVFYVTRRVSDDEFLRLAPAAQAIVAIVWNWSKGGAELKSIDKPPSYRDSRKDTHHHNKGLWSWRNFDHRNKCFGNIRRHNHLLLFTIHAVQPTRCRPHDLNIQVVAQAQKNYANNCASRFDRSNAKARDRIALQKIAQRIAH